jgi:hypothetical protein
MGDPVSIAASAVGLAAFAATLAKFIHQSHDYVQSADSTIRDFGDEINVLSQVLANLGASLSDKRFHTAYTRVGVGSEQTGHLSSLSKVVADCSVSLKRLESILVKVADGGSLARGPFRKKAVALKLYLKSAEIARIRTQVHGYQQALELGLHLVNM